MSYHYDPTPPITSPISPAREYSLSMPNSPILEEPGYDPHEIDCPACRLQVPTSKLAQPPLPLCSSTDSHIDHLLYSLTFALLKGVDSLLLYAYCHHVVRTHCHHSQSHPLPLFLFSLSPYQYVRMYSPSTLIYLSESRSSRKNV